ncbi:MAG: hypothetical protein Q8P93_03110 [bacterium]|nr:hypothetical protein [bacterium]
MDRIRNKRNKQLAMLDIDFIREVEQQDTTKQQKQVLRDLPKTFSLTTPPAIEDLKKRWPRELGED